MTYSHNTTAFALSLTFDLASIRFKVRPFKLLRTPSPHDHLPRLPILRILSEQSRRFLLGAGQHNKGRLLVHRALCCSVRVALSFVSSRTTVTNDPPLSVPFAILCTVFSKNERLNAILIQHTGSLHRFFIFHNILFGNKQKQEKYICLKLHIEKSDCHPLS